MNTQVVYLTPEEAAAILKVSPATVQQYARRGIVPARKIGKHWRFLEAELLQAGQAGRLTSRAPTLAAHPVARARVAQIVRNVRSRMKLTGKSDP